MDNTRNQKGIFYPDEIAQMRDELKLGEPFIETVNEQEDRAASIIVKHQRRARPGN